MRAPNAYLVNGILLLVAIASWSVFLHQNSPARQKAAAEAFGASLLSRQLPELISGISLEVDTPDGKPVDAFPSLAGTRVTSTMTSEIDMLMQFYVLMGTSQITDDHRDWKRLGTARITSKESRVTEIEVFEIPHGQLGFLHGGSYYKTTGGVRPMMSFIRDVQKNQK